MVVRSHSGILVLQERHDYKNLPPEIFPPQLLKAMRHDLFATLYHRKTFDQSLFLKVKDILMVRFNVYPISVILIGRVSVSKTLRSSKTTQ